MAIRPAVFQRQAHVFTSTTFSCCQQKIFEIAGKVSKKAEMEIFFALNFRVPSSSPSPVFAPPPCSAGSLEVWAHDLSTDLSGDSVCLGAVGQGVPLVHAVPATTQRWAWRDPSGQGWKTLLVFTLIWLCSGYYLFFQPRSLWEPNLAMMFITVNALPIAKLLVKGWHKSIVPCWLVTACDYHSFKNCDREALSCDPAAHPLPRRERQINIYYFSK